MTPCTPTFAIVPPGATMSSQSTKVAGTPTASIAVSTPRPPVRFMTASAAAPSAALIDCRRAKTLGDVEAIIVEIDHDDLSGRIELRRQQRRETDRAGTDDRDAAARLDLTVEHAAFEAGGQDIAEHHQSLFIDPGGNRIKAGVGVRDPHVFGLRAVDPVAEDPAASRAVRIHTAAAIGALAAGRDAGDQNAITWMERRDPGADLLDHADAFVAEDTARGYSSGHHL